MSWQAYIDSLLSDENIDDAAIVGHENGCESVWGACPNGMTKNITVPEIKSIVSNSRQVMLQNGLNLFGLKWVVVRDVLLDDKFMIMRSKATTEFPDIMHLIIGMSPRALVLVKGGKDAKPGSMNTVVGKMTSHLKNSGY